MAKRARYLIRQWGHQIIGLDGLFKLSKMRWPVWAVVVQDTQGHAWPVVFVFASIERTEILARALRCLHRHVVEDGEPWKPIVMIDKDEVERGAVAAMGWEYLLCDFHVQKTWRAVLRQTSLRGKKINAAKLLVRLKLKKSDSPLGDSPHRIIPWSQFPCRSRRRFRYHHSRHCRRCSRRGPHGHRR